MRADKLTAQGVGRLAVVLVLFPATIAYLLPQLEFADALLKGARENWLYFWALAAAIEWAAVLLVIAMAASGAPRTGIRIGFGPVTTIIGAALLALAVAAAVLLPGLSPAVLAEIPAGATMFIPPPEVGHRLFWVFMSATAAFCEEILFRGVAIAELRKMTGVLLAVLISALAFAFFHGGLEQGPIWFGVRFTIALLFSALTLWSGRLAPAMLVHFALDASILAAGAA